MQEPQSTKPQVTSTTKKDVRLVVRDAVLNSTVLLFMLISCGILYVNFVAIAPYVNSIIWGILISIPLHFLKRQLITMLMDSNDPHFITPGTLRALVWSFIKHGIKIMWAPMLSIYYKICPLSIQKILTKRTTAVSAAGKVSGHTAKVKVNLIYSHISGLPSSYYFGILFSASAWWIFYKLVKQIPLFGWALICLLFFLFASLKIVRQSFGFLWRSVRKITFGLSSPKSSSEDQLKKEETEMKLHSLLASFLVFGSYFIFITLLILTSVQTVFHGQQVVTSGVSSLMTGDQYIGIRSSASEYAISAATWLDGQINNQFPGANFSVSQLLEALNEVNTNNTDPFTLFCDQVIQVLNNYELKVSGSLIESYFMKRSLNTTFSYGELMDEWKKAIDDSWKAISSNPNIDWFKETGSNIASMATSTSARVLTILVHGASFLSHCAVTASIAHAFVARQSSVLEDLGYLLEKSIDANGIFQKSIEATLNAIFSKITKTFIWHSIFTWLSFEILGVPFSLSAGFLSGVISVLPVASSFSLIIIPFGVGYLGIAERSIIKSIILLYVHFFYADCIHPLIYKDILVSSSATATQALPSEKITGISIALGVISFGAKGIVFGPLLACAPGIILSMYQSMMLIDSQRKK